jgi:hypothetical protein
LDFALYTEHPNRSSDVGRLLTDRRMVTGDGETTWVVDTPPAYIAIDPNLRRIERDRGDNVRRVYKAQSP